MSMVLKKNMRRIQQLPKYISILRDANVKEEKRAKTMRTSAPPLN